MKKLPSALIVIIFCKVELDRHVFLSEKAGNYGLDQVWIDEQNALLIKNSS